MPLVFCKCKKSQRQNLSLAGLFSLAAQKIAFHLSGQLQFNYFNYHNKLIYFENHAKLVIFAYRKDNIKT
jgi:hypothetical protein